MSAHAEGIPSMAFMGDVEILSVFAVLFTNGIAFFVA